MIFSVADLCNLGSMTIATVTSHSPLSHCAHLSDCKYASRVWISFTPFGNVFRVCPSCFPSTFLELNLDSIPEAHGTKGSPMAWSKRIYVFIYCLILQSSCVVLGSPPWRTPAPCKLQLAQPFWAPTCAAVQRWGDQSSRPTTLLTFDRHITANTLGLPACECWYIPEG